MADLTDAAKALRVEVWHLTGSERLARYRREWPDFWQAVDDLVAALDATDGGPTPILDA